ncbi:hypothetical protein ES288_D11G208600v1 [Gossypium darwinii]|uniref:Uncharacterized protein n=1 Tax=Gossypium darwinii TaxID=34276 RepID=A0A5D2ARP2_GOSDA|nr:hypothetical protein ES288_D11G208600v1 [Gossypium darwinii]
MSLACALLPFFSIRVHFRHQSTSADPPPVLHASTHFQNHRLERSYKRLLPLNFKETSYLVRQKNSRPR